MASFPSGLLTWRNIPTISMLQHHNPLPTNNVDKILLYVCITFFLLHMLFINGHWLLPPFGDSNNAAMNGEGTSVFDFAFLSIYPELNMFLTFLRNDHIVFTAAVPFNIPTD